MLKRRIGGLLQARLFCQLRLSQILQFTVDLQRLAKQTANSHLDLGLVAAQLPSIPTNAYRHFAANSVYFLAGGI